MHKKLYYGAETFEKILSASNKLAKHVGSTMGPSGKNVIIKDTGYPTVVTQDGVTVARSIYLEDQAEDSVKEIIKQAAVQLEEKVGDGTTTVTVLINELLEYAKTSGIPTKEFIGMLEDELQDLISYVKKSAKTKITKKELIQTATVSAKDETIGKLVAGVVWELGAKATISVEESPADKDSVDTVAGYELPYGWVSHYMAPGREVIMESPHVVVCDMNLRDKQDILPILQAVNASDNKKVVVFARQIGGDALSLMVINKLKSVVDIVAVEIEDGAVPASDMFEDISVATGANIISRQGRHVDTFSLKDAGSTAKAIILRDSSTLVQYGGAKEDIDAYVDALAKTKTKTDFEKNMISKRIAAIQSKVATIRIGGKTASEIQERVFRAEDAIGAAKTALQSGIVVGGGAVYQDYAIGSIAPLASTVGKLRDRIIANGAPESTVEDLIGAGVFDPLGTVIECLNTAVSTVVLLLNTDSLIVEEKEDEAKKSI